MKFKENAIRPGMVIHCPTEDDARALLEHLEELGYEWFPSGKLTENTRWERYQSGTLYCIDLNNKTIVLSNLYYGDRPSCATPLTEISDLIEPEPVRTIVRMDTLSEEYAVTKSSNIQPRDEDWTKEPPIIWTRCREDWIDGDVKYVNAEPWARDGWHKTSTDSPADSPMGAVEVLEWLKHAGKGTLVNMFGTVICDEILLDNTPQDIINKITAYEAARKEQKPVEVEEGYFCELYEKKDNSDAVILGYNMWSVDKNTAVKGVQEKARKRVIETGKPCYSRVTYKCRVKEAK